MSRARDLFDRGMRRRTGATNTRPRAFVLIAVLIITGSALLVATALIHLTTADAAAAVDRRRALQDHALAWSGLQVIAQRLDEQRETILAGSLPELDDQYEIYESASRLGVVRLLPLRNGQRLVPEAGKLDLNHVDADMLVATGLITTELADAIIAHRGAASGRPFQSVAELLDVEGVTPELLYGPLDELSVMGEASGEEAGVGERIALRLDDQPVKGLADAVTVFAVEPALQQSGVRRIHLDLSWNDELARRCDRRFGPLAADVQALFRSASIKEDGDIAEVLRRRSVAEESLPELLDTFTAEAGDERYGRIDINTAPYEVISALPGLEPGQAEQFIRVRDQLSDSERASIAWPLLQKILDPSAFASLAGMLTTRSFTYRVRIAAGEVDAAAPDGPLVQPVIFEAVIDLCDPTPRIAYLRDITLLQTAARLASAGALDAPESEESADEPAAPSDEADAVAADDAEPAASPASPPTDDAGDAFPAPENAGTDSSMPSASGDPGADAPPPTSSAPASARRVGRWKSGSS